MSIEFDCPQCSTKLRVSDGASRQRGNCPQCGTAVIVPRVDVPGATEGVLETDSAIVDFVAVTAGDSDDLATQRAARIRGGFHPIRWLIALSFLSIVPTIGYWYYETHRPPRGSLTALVLNESELTPVLIPRDMIDLPSEQLDTVLEEYAVVPIKLKSQSMSLQFSGSRDGFYVTLQHGKSHRFFRVDPKLHDDLAAIVGTETTQLDAPRVKELRGALRQFLNPDSSGQGDLRKYRDSIGLNALVRGAGYHLEAVVAQRGHRCVYVDKRGRLYFVLPKNTQSFEIHNREIDDVAAIFSGNYTVEVAPQTKPDSEPEDPEFPESEVVAAEESISE